MRFLKLGLATALLAAAFVAPAGAQDVNKSDNVRSVAKIKYWGGSHLSFDGNYAYASNWDGRGERPKVGGVRIMDLRGTPRQVGYFKCPGADVDAQPVKPGLVAVGHSTARCNLPDAGESGEGIYLLDVNDPTRPKLLGSVNLPTAAAVPGHEKRFGGWVHSITPYPGKPIVYTNPGGLPTNGLLLTHMIDVSNPRKPEIVGSFRPPGLPTGCHDFSFHFDKRGKFGFCTGLQGTQIWDVSDPLAP
ncbi:MAG: hypothetical protein M3161_04850, partial [Actinomycetota bacterium]|nr:hypothetical protein [Actinomycetota bacterium]